MTALRGRTIALWVEARRGQPAVNPVIRHLLADLEAAGAAVSVRVPEAEPVDPATAAGGGAPDLVLLKTAMPLALALALADEASGTRFLNGARATWLAQDKAATVARLAAAGLPVPVTGLLGGPVRAGDHPSFPAGAWVRKPVRGVHGRDVTMHPSFASATALGESSDDGAWLVQRRIGGDDADVKVYVAGEAVFAGTKRFGPDSYQDDGIVPCALDSRTREVVLAAGAALGLRCFGVDLRADGADHLIVDVNPFPGYRGFPATAAALRSEIERRLRGDGA